MVILRDSHVKCSAAMVAQILLEDLGTPVSFALSSLLKKGEYQAYLDSKIDYSAYESPDAFVRDYLAISILSKADFLPLGIDTRQVALDKFAMSEEACVRAAVKLRDLRSGSVSITDPRHEVFNFARRKIASLLGPFDWNECHKFFGFGPGACVNVPRRNGDSYYKYGHLRPSVTQGCLALAIAAIRSIPIWHRRMALLNGEDPETWFTVVPGNKITTVPKSAKTDRVTATEPLMNMYVQKGIGAVLRRRLKRVGIDLDDQRRNQTLAAVGSITGNIATVDLSSASDTVSLALVEDLLPPDWVDALQQCRSPVGTLPCGKKLYYRKISSMGNGFTFELESLIFWALSLGVCRYLGVSESCLTVYGDDIVISSDCVPLLREVLDTAGFTFNSEKSFWDGPFRESCGKHYFRGHDVTPFFIKKALDSDFRLFWAANSIRRHSHSCVGDWGCSDSHKRAWDYVVSFLPNRLRRPVGPLYLPSTHVDGEPQPFNDGLGGDFDEVRPSKAKHGLEGWRVPAYTRYFIERKTGDDPTLLKSLGVIEASSNVTSVEPSLLLTARWKWTVNRKLSIPQWADVGPWLPYFNMPALKEV